MPFHYDRFYFGIIWVTVFLGIVAFKTYREQRAYLDACERTKGTVIDKVALWKRSKYGGTFVPYPQFSFPVGDTNYIFTDRTVQMEIGETATIIYLRNQPRSAQVYTWDFWLGDWGFYVPYFFICILLHSVIDILMSRHPEKTVILPRNQPL
jgi:hypothetical protein